MYRWILFDADGTLFDYESAERAAFDGLWRQAALPRRDDPLGAYQRINSELWRRFEAGETTPEAIKTERFRLLLEELEVDADAAHLSAAYLELLARQTQLVPGARRLLERLAGERRLGVMTNGLAAVQRPRLQRSPIGRFFEVLVISEEVGYAKPDPRIFEHALTLMGRPSPDEVLMVGDNLRADIEGALRAGLPACWLNLGGAERRDGVSPTHEIHALGELAAVLRPSARSGAAPAPEV